MFDGHALYKAIYLINSNPHLLSSSHHYWRKQLISFTKRIVRDCEKFDDVQKSRLFNALVESDVKTLIALYGGVKKINESYCWLNELPLNEKITAGYASAHIKQLVKNISQCIKPNQM
mgnify:CR=1 FL=1